MSRLEPSETNSDLVDAVVCLSLRAFPFIDSVVGARTRGYTFIVVESEQQLGLLASEATGKEGGLWLSSISVRHFAYYLDLEEEAVFERYLVGQTVVSKFSLVWCTNSSMHIMNPIYVYYSSVYVL